MRSKKLIQEEETKYFDLVWYSRFLHSTTERPEAAIINASRIEFEYSNEDLALAMSDFGIGMLNGKLSALRWMLGEEWDFLDT